MASDKYANLYRTLSNRLVERGIVTREQCDIIARVGHRKNQYHARHIYDLADFALMKIKEHDKELVALRNLCVRMKQFVTTQL